MSVLKLTQMQTFRHNLSPKIEISGNIRGHHVECVLYNRDTFDACILNRADIEALLPIFKELLELS